VNNVQPNSARLVFRPTHPPPPFKSKGVHSIDPLIEHEVKVLWENGIETFESCQGGDGHAFSEPIVRFHGDRAEGMRALAIALQCRLKVTALNRRCRIIDGEPDRPFWEMTFTR
jgi:hypothetical protein